MNSCERVRATCAPFAKSQICEPSAACRIKIQWIEFLCDMRRRTGNLSPPVALKLNLRFNFNARARRFRVLSRMAADSQICDLREAKGASSRIKIQFIEFLCEKRRGENSSFPPGSSRGVWARWFPRPRFPRPRFPRSPPGGRELGQLNFYATRQEVHR